MNKTKIDWCDVSWNPVTGCRHGCEYCYARGIAHRFGGRNNALTLRDCGVHTTKEGCYEVEDPVPNTRNGKVVSAPFPFGFEPTFHSYRLCQPENTKKPQTIFVCSMADLFGAWVPDEWIEAVFKACLKAPQHRYLFLTKNPGRYIDLWNSGALPREDNFWYGSTATNGDMPVFFSDKVNTFVSMEPLSGPFEDRGSAPDTPFADWFIIGAETGNRKEKVVPKREWIDSIVKHAKKYGKPVFMKSSLIPIMGEGSMRQELPWQKE